MRNIKDLIKELAQKNLQELTGKGKLETIRDKSDQARQTASDSRVRAIKAKTGFSQADTQYQAAKDRARRSRDLIDRRNANKKPVQEAFDLKKLTSLGRAGLFDASKISLLRRALEKDNARLNVQERSALLQLLDTLLDQVTNDRQVFHKVRQNAMSEGVGVPQTLRKSRMSDAKASSDDGREPNSPELKKRWAATRKKTLDDASRTAATSKDPKTKTWARDVRKRTQSQVHPAQDTHNTALKMYADKKKKGVVTEDKIDDDKNRKFPRNKDVEARVDRWIKGIKDGMNQLGDKRDINAARGRLKKDIKDAIATYYNNIKE